MYAFNADETRHSYTELSAADLVIYEFDQWGNSRQPSISPTTACWFEPEPACGTASAGQLS